MTDTTLAKVADFLASKTAEFSAWGLAIVGFLTFQQWLAAGAFISSIVLSLSGVWVNILKARRLRRKDTDTGTGGL